jgi:hypothetical protein
MLRVAHLGNIAANITAKEMIILPEDLMLGNEPRLFYLGDYDDRIGNRNDLPNIMKKEGYRPASFGDLLLFAASNSELKPVIWATGTIKWWYGVEYTPCILGNGRHLELRQHGEWWSANGKYYSYFLGVRI